MPEGNARTEKHGFPAVQSRDMTVANGGDADAHGVMHMLSNIGCRPYQNCIFPSKFFE